MLGFLLFTYYFCIFAKSNYMDKEQRFGTTEISDPCFHLEIFDNLYDGNLIITKRLTPLFIDKLVENKTKIILHICVTGMGGSKIEPLVPPKEAMYNRVMELINKGFPVEQIVLRVDPIVPTEKGIATAISVIELFKDTGIKRVRISFLDMYKHVKERFKENDVSLPYETFHADNETRWEAFSKIFEICDKNNMSVEMCGEPLVGEPFEFKTTPCLSQKDVDILGLDGKIKLEGNKEARTHCGCPKNKYELIKDKPHRCEHRCLYCFWKN